MHFLHCSHVRYEQLETESRTGKGQCGGELWAVVRGTRKGAAAQGTDK
jgi:hypothetical protein